MKLAKMQKTVLAALLCGAMAAQAAPSWPQVPFKYFARQAPLPRVLGDFAGAFGLTLAVSPKINGRLNGDFTMPSPTAFLDGLAANHGLVWFSHSGVLHVTHASESISRSIRVAKSDLSSLRGALERLGVADPRFGWGEFPERGVVLVSGPPAYVDLVARTVSELGSDSGFDDGQELHIFPLKHARAEDRAFSYRGLNVTTPGVATILRGLAGNSGASLKSGTSTSPKKGEPGIAPEGAPGTAGGGTNNPSKAPAGTIEIDQRRNAIVVRDTHERIVAYAALITQLDVPTPLVEIEAAIVDVKSDRTDTLGVSWSARAGKVSASFGTMSTTLQGGGLSFATGDPATLPGTAGYFMAQINALASRGEATVLAQPSVLTSDNMAAVLDLSQTLYVSVVGERVAELVPVATGTLLKVTPRVVEDNGLRMVHLTVDIEDGALQGKAAPGTPPTVLQSNISTQAVVRESESLLIGGYTFDAENKVSDSVPFLGAVPVLGKLFRNDSTTRNRSRRMFLISPRIIAHPSTPSGAETRLDPSRKDQS